MVNLTGGKNHKKGKNINVHTRELLFREDGQDYGYITAMLGNRRCTIKGTDNIEKLGHIRGNMRKSTQRVKLKDVVLVSLRDYQEGKVDIIHVYTDDETKSLIRYEEITEGFAKNESDIDDMIVFSENECDFNKI